MPEQINVFIIYAREDRGVKQGLLRHLNPLRESYNLNIWHDDHIEPGQEWKPSIESRLEQTDLFLLLVSADFMNSEFIHQVEFKFAIDRHKQNKSIVIPVIIDYCIWDIDIRYKDYTFNLKDLQVLPDEGKPIGEWKTPEQAYNNIAGGIRKVLSTIREKNSEIISTESKKIETERIREENIKQEKLKKEKDESLQRQILEQKENEEQDNTYIITPQENSTNKSATRRIIFSLLILTAVFILAYFIFHKPAKRVSDGSTPGDTTIITSQNTAKTNNIETSGNAANDKNNSGKPALIPTKDNKTQVPVNSFNKFPSALTAVFNDAVNNFVNLKGAFVGTEDGMKKYKTSLQLHDKSFRSLYLFQNGRGWKFEFVNENNSNYESIRSTILNLLRSNKIKFEHESSASVGFERFTWNNEAFEIYLSTRKYTDNFIEVDFYHRD